MASSSYRRALNTIDAHIVDEVKKQPDGFTLSVVAADAHAWLMASEQAELLSALALEIIEASLYGEAQRAIARGRSGKILHHGVVRNLDEWKAEVHQRISLIQNWNELIDESPDGGLRRHKHILEMTGRDFLRAARTRRNRAKTEIGIAELWEKVGRDLGWRKAKEVYKDVEGLATRTLELQGVDKPPQ